MSDDWPLVTICIITYDRLREIKSTIHALREHFHYIGPVAWHVADDSSPQGYIGHVFNEFPDIKFTFSTTKRQGWGANANAALHALSNSPYVFLCEDDYVCQRPLNITQGVALIESDSSIGLVRYDGIAAHIFTMHLKEAETRIGRFSYMVIDKDSPHLNVYSNRPHLKHKRFHGCYGWYPEGVPLGETETKFAHQVKDKKDCPDLAILADGIPTAFDHIGASRQGSTLDVHFKG